MKKFIVLLVALCVASTAFAADFMFSWDTDWGWASNFDDTYDAGYGELELAISVEVDEYNTMDVEYEVIPNDGFQDADNPTNFDQVKLAQQMNSFKITTDLGAYFGLPVGVSWVNGYTDPGDEEYSDIGNVGYANAGAAVGLAKDFVTDVNLDFGMFWASVASNWNLGSEGYAKELLLLAGAVDAVPGLSFEVGYEMATSAADSESSIFQFDAAYAYAMDMMDVTVAGSYSTKTDDVAANEGDAFGAGLDFNYNVDDMTALNASVSFKGDDDESFSDIGGGVGATYGDFGADVDFSYNMAGGSEEMDFVDISGFMSVGAVKFTVGHVVTDYGLDNNSTAPIPTEGGSYFKVTADF